VRGTSRENGSDTEGKRRDRLGGLGGLGRDGGRDHDVFGERLKRGRGERGDSEELVVAGKGK
jgi:hypothetical protein